MKFLSTTFFRKAHRWLGLIVSIQLLMWTASGLFFSIPDITDVRGEQYLSQTHSININQLAREKIVPISAIIDTAKINLEANETVLLKHRAGRLIYQVEKNAPEKKLIFDALTGQPMTYITPTEALSIVVDRTELSPTEAVLINEPKTGSEFRGRDLPLYKVTVTKPKKGIVYVDPVTGEIAAIRTKLWRAWDFLWSLHIMDYQERDDFSQWLLRLFSALGVLTVLSGIILWFYSGKIQASKLS
ncbi:MAG: PepSY domain-containing protein [Gammaproteobacteria bacterium]|jgi:uncharacterized iron-regulated membrane protein|nr:hypothetical protein [Gammaproteobacteria bacterium]HIK96750.1 hypothetical protein [Gammaproteobacteria bacterium]